MAHLRLLADDLTGALDSAARFLPLTGPVAVTWQEARSRARSRSTAARATCRGSSAHAHRAPRAAAGRRCAGIQEDRQSVARPCCAGTRGLHAPVRSLCAGTGVPVPGPYHPRRPPACAHRRRLARHRRRSSGRAARAWRRGPNARCRNRRRPGCHRSRGAPSDRSRAVVRHRRAGGRARRTRHGAAPCPAAADPGADRQRPSGEPRTGRRGSGGPATGGRRVRPTGRDRPAHRTRAHRRDVPRAAGPGPAAGNAVRDRRRDAARPVRRARRDAARGRWRARTRRADIAVARR